MNELKIIHLFLGGGEQWCTEMIKYFDAKRHINKFTISHTFVSTPSEFVNDDTIIKEKLIDFNDGKKIHNLVVLNSYSKEYDYIFLYNNLLTTFDRARLKKNVLKKIVWISFGSDIDVEHNSGWVGANYINKIFNQFLLPVIEKKSMNNMSNIKAICINSIYDGLAIRRDYGNIPILPFSFLKDKSSILYYDKKEVSTDTVNIMVGHHGYPGVNHIKNLNRLMKFKDKKIHIYLPMTYGNSEYINDVKNYAYKLYGNKCTVIENNMSYDNYIDFINSIDIAILDSKKNIGSGNIRLLCNFNKKIYLNRNSKIREKLSLSGVKTNVVEQIQNESFLEFITNTNSNKISKEYTRNCYENMLEIGLSKMDILFESVILNNIEEDDT